MLSRQGRLLLSCVYVVAMVTTSWCSWVQNMVYQGRSLYGVGKAQAGAAVPCLAMSMCELATRQRRCVAAVVCKGKANTVCICVYVVEC